jgi:DNA gyrase inhibitor GyrI
MAVDERLRFLRLPGFGKAAGRFTSQDLVDGDAAPFWFSLFLFRSCRLYRAGFGVPLTRYRKRGTPSRFRPALSGDDQMTIAEVVIRSVEPFTLLSVDHVGPYMQIGKAFDALFGWLARHDLLEAEMRMIGIYFDDPGVVDEKALRFKAGVLLPQRVLAAVAVSSPVLMVAVKGGDYAVLRHTGPYSDMRRAYEWFYRKWLVQSGHRAADAPVFEEYLNSPKDTAPEGSGDGDMLTVEMRVGSCAAPGLRGFTWLVHAVGAPSQCSVLRCFSGFYILCIRIRSNS